MNRDLLKTIGGILIIAAIVVATFLYGNQQRQEQVRRDQALQEQQSQAEQEQPAGEAQQPPTANSTQPDGVGGGSLPRTTPEAGSEVGYIVATATLLWVGTRQRASRRNLRRAALR
jgi:hypothetical protein